MGEHKEHWAHWEVGLHFGVPWRAARAQHLSSLGEISKSLSVRQSVSPPRVWTVTIDTLEWQAKSWNDLDGLQRWSRGFPLARILPSSHPKSLKGKHLYDWQETQLASTWYKEYSTYSTGYLRGGLRPVVVLPNREQWHVQMEIHRTIVTKGIKPSTRHMTHQYSQAHTS